MKRFLNNLKDICIYALFVEVILSYGMLIFFFGSFNLWLVGKVLLFTVGVYIWSVLFAVYLKKVTA